MRFSKNEKIIFEFSNCEKQRLIKKNDVASTCYPVSLVAILVLVTMSLPQSQFRRCLRVPATDFQYVIGVSL